MLQLVLLIRFWLCIFGKITEMMLCSSLCPMRWHAICPIGDDIHFDHLSNVFSARLLHSKATLSSFVTNRYFVERIFETIEIFIHVLIYISIET